MHWSLYVLMGAILNAMVNWGYKTEGAKENLFLFVGCVFSIAAIFMFCYAGFTKNLKIGMLMNGTTPLIILGMGIGVCLVMVLFVSALTKGPLSIVDPMWACVYTLASLAIGLLIIRETPSALSLGGIALYLLGAILMSKA